MMTLLKALKEKKLLVKKGNVTQTNNCLKDRKGRVEGRGFLVVGSKQLDAHYI